MSGPARRISDVNHTWQLHGWEHIRNRPTLVNEPTAHDRHWQPYSLREWKEDIALAASRGMYVISFPLLPTVFTNGSPSDAFALNVGPEDWQYEQVARCYAAALELDARFKLFISFDMTCVPRLKLDYGPGRCAPRPYTTALCLCDFSCTSLAFSQYWCRVGV